MTDLHTDGLINRRLFQVGMATNIPPHNLVEVVDAFLAVIDNPDISLQELMQICPGPDFPTGATILGTAG